MNNEDFNNRLASDMIDIFGFDTIMKYFVYKAKADMRATIQLNDNIKTYILIDRVSGLYKIGKTSDLKKRLQMLSCGNPNIELLFTIDSDIEDELHKELKSKRVKGEWFSLTIEDVEYLRKKWCEKYTPSPLQR